MSVLKRVSNSVLNIVRMGQESGIEMSTASQCPEAVDSRRKNRRMAKLVAQSLSEPYISSDFFQRRADVSLVVTLRENLHHLGSRIANWPDLIQ